MVVIKYFDEFEGVYRDVTGTTGQTLRFGSNGKMDNSLPEWGDITGNIQSQADLKNELSQLVAISNWVDISNTTTISGFSSVTTKKVRYMVSGNMRIVHYQIIGTSNANTFSFTLPFNATSFADQFFIGHAIDNTSTHNIVTAKISASGNTVNLYLGNDTSANNWTTSGTKQAEGTLVIAM